MLALQGAAGNRAVARLVRRASGLGDAPRVLARHPANAAAKQVLKKGLKWIGKGHKTISKHVAEHFLPAATTKLVHGIFRVRNVKRLAVETLTKPDNVVHELHRGGQWVVEKAFGREIGTAGETILHVVLTTGGKVVSAYPVKAFTAAATGAAVLFLRVDEACAQARPELDALELAIERKIEERTPGFWEELLSDIVTFGLYGGTANTYEDVYLWAGRSVGEIVARAGDKAIRGVEEAEQRSLGQAESERIRTMVAGGLVGVELGDADAEAGP